MNFRAALSALVLCIPLQFVRTEEWTHHTVLDVTGRYHLYWKTPADKSGNGEIVFKVEVRAKGYVGFGLSYRGAMAGSDIVTGWVKDGQPYFQDRHATGNTLPEKDQKQDWILMEAKENDTHTTLTFRRKLNTCDEEDRVIGDGVEHVIFAFSDEDPTGDQPFYHSVNRGMIFMMLLRDRPKTISAPEDPSLLHFDIRAPKLDFPPYEYFSWCRIFKPPSITKKHHIVQIKPLIQEGHEQLVNYMTLFECGEGISEEFGSYLYPGAARCYDPDLPDAMLKCGYMLSGWAVGLEDTVFPEYAGLPLEPGKYYMFEIRYNSQPNQDESGLRMYYTPNLREHDIGSLFLGAEVSPRYFIPPGQKKYEVAGHSNPECLDSEMPAGGIKVLATFTHIHFMGRSITVRHFRGNRELPPLSVDKNAESDFQEYRYLNEEVSFLPGDQITVECSVDSSPKSTVTFNPAVSLHDKVPSIPYHPHLLRRRPTTLLNDSESTPEDIFSQEMCGAIILYYPRMEVIESKSIPTYSAINRLLNTNATDGASVFSTLSQYNWTNVDVSELENGLMYSEHDSYCHLRNGQIVQTKSTISYPSDLEPFVQADTTCSERTVESSVSSKAVTLGAYFPLLSLVLASAIELIVRKLTLHGFCNF